jgi:excisionase family DNA binding protein
MSKRKEIIGSKVESGLMTSADAGHYLRCNQDTLRKWIEGQGIAYYQLGHRKMFRKEDLDAFIERHRVDHKK